MFDILKSKNTNNLLLKTVKKYSWKKIKVKVNKQLLEEHKINHRVKESYPLSPTVLKIYINELIKKMEPVQSVQK